MSGLCMSNTAIQGFQKLEKKVQPSMKKKSEMLAEKSE